MKILYFKTLPKLMKSTEEMALDALNNPKYDNFPQFIDKDEIQHAFDEYGYKLNPFNSSIYTNVLNAPNIEGHFLSINIPEIESAVVDGTCTSDEVRKILDKEDDISHIGISAYAFGLDNVIDIINTLKTDYPDKTIYVGNVGAVFPYVRRLIDPQNICIGDGVNWLRKKFDLPMLSRSDIKIPFILSDTSAFPVKMKSLYMVTQIGCPFSCDFCISKLLQYNPFCSAKKIIEYIEEAKSQTNKDFFLYLCDPNACFPERVWKEVFNYFMNEGKSDNYAYIICLISLAHLNKFDLKNIQENSSVKFFLVNYGIESTLMKGYRKNRGITNEFTRVIAKEGIISNQNFILGLPFHNEKNIDLEIQRNLEYESCWYYISTLKPLPMTDIYDQLYKSGRIFGEDMPPEFVYWEGFFPFEHMHLGKGFSALKYAFKAYYETEKKVLNVYSTFAEALLKSPAIHTSSYMQKIVKLMGKMGEMNSTLFKLRMDKETNVKYDIKINHFTSEMQERFY